MSYMHFIFWKDKEERPLEKIRNVAASMYSEKAAKKADLRESEDRLVLAFKDFQFTFVFISENWIIEESRDIADTFGKNRKDHSIIRDSKSRIEFYGDDDPDMNYFNDYLLILEKIQRELLSSYLTLSRDRSLMKYNPRLTICNDWGKLR